MRTEVLSVVWCVLGIVGCRKMRKKRCVGVHVRMDEERRREWNWTQVCVTNVLKKMGFGPIFTPLN